MKYNYQFSSIIGSSYQNGQICFSPDGNSILSPVGNNISLLYLKRDEIKTIEVNSSYNIQHIAVSPKYPILLSINEEGYANIVSMITGHVINHHNFRQQINCASFSPNGKFFAVGRRNLVMVYYAPSLEKPQTQLRLQRTYDGSSADVRSIDWSSDSKAFVVGSNDHSTRVYAAFKTDKLIIYSLSGNAGNVIKCCFMKNTLDVFSVSKNAQLCFWKCNKSLEFLSNDADSNKTDINKKRKNAVTYSKSRNLYYRNLQTDNQLDIEVTVADFHVHTNLLATGFVDGNIMIHEMPDFTPRYYLKVCEGEISTIAFNGTGNWIAIGSQEDNQLNVFCWKSQSFIFQSKGHKRSLVNCLDYSPDGIQLVTGGREGNVKFWQIASGRCFATFNNHSGPVTGVVFPKQKPQTVFSSSLDGTVCGYDLTRLRTFCTLTAEERSYQFTCVATDYKGELVAAGGGSDCFGAMVWLVKTRKLLYILSDHEQPVCSIEYAVNVSGTYLVTGSWDKTMRIWQFSGDKTSEVLTNTSDVLAVAFRPDGLEIAGALLNGNIVFYDALSGDQVKEIEGKHDLGFSKADGELLSVVKVSEEKNFQAICYSADGRLILAGGNSKYICLYSIEQKLLLKRFQISSNMSLDGILEIHDRRKITHWGFSDSHIDMSDKKAVPGAVDVMNCKRQIKLDVMVTSIKFSPTGTHFAAATSEGVLVFSGEKVFRKMEYIGGAIDFSQFDLDLSPESIRKDLANSRYSQALIGALKLKKLDLMTEVIESIPNSEVAFIVKQLDIDEVGMVFCRYLTHQLKVSKNAGFYFNWLKAVQVAWTITIWKSSNIEWKTIALDIENCTKLIESKLSAGQATIHKLDMIRAMVQKQSQIKNE